ncbi:MAG: SDR family oxidoreductase [Chitinophagaceae bacterium]|nr:SDR family oxidoreductase [Chitinophagaceae bacterium]
MNIIITGASKGLGKAFALKFAQENNQLFLCARNTKNLKDTVDEIKKLSPATIVHFKTADVSIKTEAIKFAEWCLSIAVPNILINNAGAFLPGTISEEADGVLEEMIAINLYSAYHITRAVLPKMKANKSGHIFNMCSIASTDAYANGGSYSISKFALMGFSKNLREELKQYNIKVTSIIPGAIYTDSWKGSGIDENRIMKDSDIAELVFAATQLSPQACVEEIVIRPQLGDL